MSFARIIVCLLVLVVVILRVLFTAMRIRLKNYRLPFELIYILSIAISVVKISEYISHYLAGDLSAKDFEISFILEIGTYSLNLLSIATYFIRQKEAKLTENMYDKCEVCGGVLYAYAPPRYSWQPSCLRRMHANY